MTSPLSALNNRAQLAAAATPQIRLHEVHPFSLIQISAWPDRLDRVGHLAATAAGCSAVARPGRSLTGGGQHLLRVEPLKWWVISERKNMHLPDIDRQLGTVLDLSHSRTWLRLSGDKTPTLLNHFLPIDLRESAFATGAVASTALHHVGVTLWREASAYSLLIPRSFALSLWELVTETAQQYGVAVN